MRTADACARFAPPHLGQHPTPAWQTIAALLVNERQCVLPVSSLHCPAARLGTLLPDLFRARSVQYRSTDVARCRALPRLWLQLVFFGDALVRVSTTSGPFSFMFQKLKT